MTKEELITAIAEKTGYNKKTTKATIEAMQNIIVQSLKKGEEVKLVGFGTWKKVHRAAKKGRNPQTGEAIEIPEYDSVKFVVGKNLKEAVLKKTL